MDGPGNTHKEGAPMITLTRLSGSVFVLNSDLIERIDSTPDSVVTLIDGKKYVVTETLDEIVERVRAYRGEVVAFGSQLAEDPHGAYDSAAATSAVHAAQHAGSDRPTLVPVPHGEA
jgi:flagellar protein FlbD